MINCNENENDNGKTDQINKTYIDQQGRSQKFLAQTVSFSKLKAKGLYDMLKACPTQLGVWGVL